MDVGAGVQPRGGGGVGEQGRQGQQRLGVRRVAAALVEVVAAGAKAQVEDAVANWLRGQQQLERHQGGHAVAVEALPVLGAGEVGEDGRVAGGDELEKQPAAQDGDADAQVGGPPRQPLLPAHQVFEG